MSDIEIMEFPYGAFLKVRLEFVLLRDNELEAKIMRIIEGWMIDQKKAWMNACAQAASDGKPEPPEPDYYITLSYAQIIAQLYMFNSSRKGEGKEVVEGKENSISRRTVSKAMQALTDDKVVFTRPNPNQTKEYDAAQYKLNCPLVQEQMKLLPKNPMGYLGSNGRINGDPCANFSHPPCETVSHPMQNNFTSPCENSAGGDVKNFPTLIDIRNRDRNRMNESKNPNESTTPNDSLSSLPSLTSFSEQDLLAEIHRRELEQMSTPVVSIEPSVDTPQLPIVNSTTGNASTTLNVRRTDELEPLGIYSAEERVIHGYWLELGFEADINLTNKGYWGKLARHVHSLQEMRTLYEYARSQLVTAKDPTVHPGNLVKAVTAWKQKQAPPPEPPKQPTSKPYKSNAVAEHDKMVADVQARIAAQAGARK